MLIWLFQQWMEETDASFIFCIVQRSFVSYVVIYYVYYLRVVNTYFSVCIGIVGTSNPGEFLSITIPIYWNLILTLSESCKHLF